MIPLFVLFLFNHRFIPHGSPGVQHQVEVRFIGGSAGLAPVAPVVPTVEHTYTLDELANAAMTLMDKGMQNQLQELLASYGVEALPALPREMYGNFATALRGMGANI